MKALAVDLCSEERRAQLGAGLDELALLARDLPRARDAVLFLAADLELAWRLYALGLLAEELRTSDTRPRDFASAPPGGRRCRSHAASPARPPVLAAAVFVSSAGASQIISTSTVSGLTLQLNAKGEALLTYTAAGRRVHVLAWGAVNAVATKPRRQAGRLPARLLRRVPEVLPAQPEGPGARARSTTRSRARPGYLASPVGEEARAPLQLAADFYWKTAFHGGCGRYDGPALAWKVVACKAPDGSYWAVQAWQRKLPNYGVSPSRHETAPGRSTSRTGRARCRC